MKHTRKEIQKLDIKYLSNFTNEVWLEDGSLWKDFKCACGEMLSKHKYAFVESEVQETNQKNVVHVLNSKIIGLNLCSENSDE